MSLELQDIHKSFGPVRANDGVSLSIEAGTLHGLLGENGAGKSTLMKILSGFISADAGRIALDGTPLTLSSPRDGIRAGIGMLHQDPLVFLPFSVLDNFLIGSGRRLRLDREAGRRALEETAGRFGFSFYPDAPARTLTVGERQQLEIARLLWLGARVLILDEPTTGISATQRTTLFEILRSLAAEGMIVAFVSHKLEEVEELCDRVTVMRRGRVVGESEMPAPAERLVEMMFGRVLVESEPTPPPFGEPVLEVDAITLRERTLTTSELSVSVREGEIVGLAGLEGSGQRMLLRAAAGLLQPESGRVRVRGRDLTRRGYRDFLRAGIHYLPAGRLEEGLVPGLTVAEHVLLARGAMGFFIDGAAAREDARGAIADYAIVGTPESTVESLSGGNQQRLLLAMTPPDARLLLMEHPTRGLDIESADWVWTRLLERRDRGSAIVFASADLDELLRYSDRILVFFSGRAVKALDARETTGEELGHLIGGKELV
ncbi:MAG TPA: ATP-binding cassette domain-containing protein [Actinomycetota bacterium]|nr:ATP-binding cassette domain-containing protein [Actinomycetota bacterium]